MKTWRPWHTLLRLAARRRGFVDPIELLARLRRFAQPSEVHEPIELVRAGMVFHARGLINTKVFQFNLDWVWPHWVCRQFDPADPAFLPRAFSFSHVNLTHRNWTALGLPGMEHYPIVDPRGLVTLPVDAWSLDWWFIPERGAPLYPSRESKAVQRLDLSRGLEVVTRFERPDLVLESAASVLPAGADLAPDGGPDATLELRADVLSRHGGTLLLAGRPANPEGVHFVEQIEFSDDGWQANALHRVQLERIPDHFVGSTYADGDLPFNLHARQASGDRVRCASGMATAAAVFVVRPGERVVLRARVPLAPSSRESLSPAAEPPRTLTWDEALTGVPTLELPETRWVFLHAAALRTLVLLSPGDIFPGPSTYRRFWFRDACLIMNALLAAHCDDRVRAALARFPSRQRADGYFHSQEGEWDANGQVLWIANRYEETTGRPVPDELGETLVRGARWITRKRRGRGRGPHDGLLPPGFSAEHLGPVAQYYWDDFWGIAGLRAAADWSSRHGDETSAAQWRIDATRFAHDVRASLDVLPFPIALLGVPSSPGRRMDAGAIGSLVADYPLQLDDVVTRDEVLRSADWLWRHSRHRGGFFQDMVHSGINAYLTLALAQTFLRHGDPRHRGLYDAVAELASPTGQWPEAVHPRTLGGCMGDGQHAWAAAEWVLAMRALFVREEVHALVVGAGLREEWFERGERLAYGPTATRWGSVTITFLRTADGWLLRISAQWHASPPRIWIETPGFERAWFDPHRGEIRLIATSPAR